MMACGCNKSQTATADKADSDNTTTVDDRNESPVDDGKVVDNIADGQGAANYIELTQDDLADAIANTTYPVVAIDFGATWCGPCQQFHPVFDQAVKKFPNVLFVYVDVDKNPESFEATGKTGIPYVVITNKKGKKLEFTGTGDLLPGEKFDAILTEMSK